MLVALERRLTLWVDLHLTVWSLSVAKGLLCVLYTLYCILSTMVFYVISCCPSSTMWAKSWLCGRWKWTEAIAMSRLGKWRWLPRDVSTTCVCSLSGKKRPLGWSTSSLDGK